jgi:hypothetical protein
MPRTAFLRSLTLAATAAALCAPPAAAEFRLERELALAPGGSLVVDAEAGAIELRGSDRSGARILITSPRDNVEERFSFTFEERGDAAVVRVERRGGPTRWFSWGGDRLRLTIEVPRRIDLDVDTSGGSIDLAAVEGEIDAHTSGGPIGARELGGTVRLDTSGGPIRVAGVDGELTAETSGGGIDVAGVSGDARLDTSGGPIDVRGAGGFVEAHSSGGPVRASFAPGNASGGTLTSSGGGITAAVDPAVGLEIDAATSGGRVTLELPVAVEGSLSRNAVRGLLNGGGPRLEMRSSGGSIHLRGL